MTDSNEALRKIVEAYADGEFEEQELLKRLADVGEPVLEPAGAPHWEPKETLRGEAVARKIRRHFS